MTLHHNCIKDTGDLKYIEIGMFGKQRKIKCEICGAIWIEEKQNEIKNFERFGK